MNWGHQRHIKQIENYTEDFTKKLALKKEITLKAGHRIETGQWQDLYVKTHRDGMPPNEAQLSPVAPHR